MRPEISKFVQDALQACDLLDTFVQGKTFDDYLADPLLRAAVEREFTIIGEALLQAQKMDASVTLHISELRRIIGFRNILVHGYAQVQNKTVWGILEKDLPGLKVELQRLLATFGPP